MEPDETIADEVPTHDDEVELDAYSVEVPEDTEDDDDD
jgi:hypothetical protein